MDIREIKLFTPYYMQSDGMRLPWIVIATEIDFVTNKIRGWATVTDNNFCVYGPPAQFECAPDALSLFQGGQEMVDKARSNGFIREKPL